MRKIKLLLLLIPLLMGTLSAHAYVDDEQVTFSGITYRVISASQKTLAVVNTSKTGHVDIPATVYDGADVTFTVTALDEGSAWESVTSVTLPNTITYIHFRAMMRASITSLHIPASVTTILEASFYHLAQLATITVDDANPAFTAVDGILYSKDMKTLAYHPRKKALPTDGIFRVPDGVEKIWANAFSSLSDLKKIVIPASVTNISTLDYGIHAACSYLTEFEVDAANTTYCSVDGVVFTEDMTELVAYPCRKNYNGSYQVPAGVTAISPFAFVTARLSSIDMNEVETVGFRAFHQSTIKNITLSASVTDIDTALENIPNQENVYVSDANPNYCSVGGVVFSKDQKKLVYYPPKHQVGSYEVPENTLEIADRAFQKISYTETVKFPTSLTTIGERAFYEASSLIDVTFQEPSAVTTIGERAFALSSLLDLRLPVSVETLGDFAFEGCSNLLDVFVPDGSQLKTIGDRCFQNSSVMGFHFMGSCELETVGSYAFIGTNNLGSFDFPATVTTIGTGAFAGCTSMKTATFAYDAVIQTIGEGAFADCGLTKITLPSSLKTIQREAFRNCNVLEEVNFDKNLTNVSPEAFKGCYKLRHISVDRANTAYSAVDGMLLTKDKQTLVLFPPGKANDSFTLLAPSITKIGDYAFYSNENLTNVTIPNKVTSIGRRAFGLCPNLNTITFLCDEMINPANIQQSLNNASFDDGVTTPHTNIFNTCDIYVRQNLLSQYEGNAFYQKFRSRNASYTPAGRKEEVIPVSAYAVSLLSTGTGTDKVTDHTYVMPETVKADGSTRNMVVAMLGDYAFQGASSSIKEVILSDNLEYIGAKAFMTNPAANTSTVENIFMLQGAPAAETFATTRFELDDTGTDYSEFARSTKVYMKKSAYKSSQFQNAMKRYTEEARTYAGQLVREPSPDMFDYKIPGISISKTYGTFAREFDVDLADYFTPVAQDGNGGTGKVIAFTASRDNSFHPGPGDNEGSEGSYYIRMRSLEVTHPDNTKTDGSYIPAGTGVLLKSMNGAASPTGFYYTIGESDINAAAQSILVGVTINNREVADTYRNIFVMSGGKFKPLNGQTITMPVHKAYLEMAGLPSTAGAKPVFLFGSQTKPDMKDQLNDNGGTTAIDNSQLATDNSCNAEIYDLQGRRVTAPQKGIYIKNGKKVIIK